MKYEFNVSKDMFKQRQQRWDNWWAIRQDGMSKSEKAVLKAQKSWYLYGDLGPLIALTENADRNAALGLSDTITLSPAQSLDELYTFIELHSMWLSENKMNYWKDGLQGVRNERFMNYVKICAFGPNVDFPNALPEGLLKLFIQSEGGHVEFPIVLGLDQWQPEIQLDLPELAWKYFTNLCTMLFSADGSEYTHLKVGLSLLDHLPKYHSQAYATSIFKERTEDISGVGRGISRISQKMTRAAVGGLLGYKNDYHEYEGPLLHNDPEIEEAVKAKLDSLAMPEEYHDLIEFIKQHPDDYLTADL